MRTEFAALLAGLALAGCAVRPALTPARAAAAATAPCPAPGSKRGPELCRHPADVRAFVDDRDLCDHFRGEPWPEGDTAADASRRRELMDGVRRECAGTDRRLAELKLRYAADPAVLLLLSGFDERIER